MSVVAIPFKDEDTSTVLSNLEIAAGHDRVDEVWAVGTDKTVSAGVPGIAAASGKRIVTFPDRRVGRFRPGKGDAMNTALLHAADRSVDRLHFYDADITNFGLDWIEGAEKAADQGFDVVRHTFPRASTDAMITWLVTKPLLAMKFPGTTLPQIGQPLGGELLLSSSALQAFANDPAVVQRSDWGVDTMYTYATVEHGFDLYEHHVADGKRHALYGDLSDLKTMLIECFDVAALLRPHPVAHARHAADPPASIPSDLQGQSGYDIDATLPLLTADPGLEEAGIIANLPDGLMTTARQLVDSGDFQALDAGRWGEVLRIAVEAFRLGDKGWEDLLFRLWSGRVVNYTVNHATKGYHHAMDYLASTIDLYEQNSPNRTG